jgi:para-nitrobenzyl esterase
MDLEAAERCANGVLAALEITPATVFRLHEAPAERLLEVYLELCGRDYKAAGGASLHAFGPVLDGVILPNQTWTPRAPELSCDVPILIGTTTDETVAFIDSGMFDPPQCDEALCDRIATAAFFASPLSRDDLRALVEGYRSRSSAATPLDLLIRISTDVGMRGHAIAQAERRIAAGGAPVYLYEFDWPTPCYGGAWALHGIEIPFVFGNLDYPCAWDGQDGPAVRARDPRVGEADRLATKVMGAWAAFARTGAPSAPGLPKWPSYALSDRETMMLGADCNVQADPRGGDRRIAAPYVTS